MESEAALIVEAREFAIRAHGDQTYGTLPYSAHLAHVERVLLAFGFASPILRAAAWLHDVLEDTETTLGNLDVRFPAEVCSLVHAVTTEPGANREERNSKTWPKIAALPDAITLKLADRIANVRNCFLTDRYDLLRMYMREYRGFREALKREDGPMWAELDSRLLARKSIGELLGNPEKPHLRERG
jgi:(p)ppGpp synthase/HD superfamily hydrolase